MELTAAIKSLKNLEHKNGVIITIRTDSQYVRKGITEWLSRWKSNKWLTSNKKPVANQDLWRELDTIVQRHQVTWEWIKGHSGDLGNERADELAVKGRDEAIKELALKTLD
jgi:ribonuclease HI